MKKVINYSHNYKQTGLKVQLKGNRVTITKGALSFSKKYTLTESVAFDLDSKISVIYLVENLITREVSIAASDGSIDKKQYHLIERLAWKTERGWERLSIEPYPKTQKAGRYNYEGLDRKTIEKGLKIQPSVRRIIRPDGSLKFEGT